MPPFNMPASHVPGDVWYIIIIENLHNPVPSPLSKPPRSAIRQKTLTILARVCQMLNEIITPLLYTTIVTDNLPRLLEVNNPGRRSSLQAYTTRLLIEYSSKQQNDPTYSQLLDRRDRWAWTACGRMEAETLALKRKDCDAELKEICELFKGGRLDGTLAKTAAALPLLKAVAVASIYGHEPGTWEQYNHFPNNDDVTPHSIFDICAMHFHQFLQHTTVHHLCVRDLFGPLGLPHCALRALNVPITTMHFDQSDVSRLSLLFGTPSRWTFDGDCTSDWDAILRAIGQRMRVNRGRRSRLPGSPQALDLDVYCSTSSSTRSDYSSYPSIFGPPPPPILQSSDILHLMSLPVQVVESSRLAVEMREYLSTDPNGNLVGVNDSDSVRWSPSASMPICEVCRSGPPASSQVELATAERG